jgi:hypothetical protein
MKTCPRCREPSDDHFDSCWRCSTPLPEPGTASDHTPPSAPPKEARKRTNFKIFRGTFATWGSLCSEAAEFASTIGPDDLINISHSEDKDDGVIVVWFWTNDFS